MPSSMSLRIICDFGLPWRSASSLAVFICSCCIQCLTSHKYLCCLLSRQLTRLNTRDSPDMVVPRIPRVDFDTAARIYAML